MENSNNDSKFDNFRTFLTNNKIIFETIATTLLSVMAIIVSFAQTILNYNYNKLVSLQTHIAEAQALPQFEIAMRNQLNEKTGKIEDSQLIISNRGGAVHDFDANSAYFLIITALTEKPDSEQIKIEFPVDGYLNAQFIHAAGSGELVKMVGHGSTQMASELNRGVLAEGQARKWPYAYMSDLLYIRLNYHDLLNRAHKDCFYVDPVTGGTKIDDATGQEMFKKWEVVPRAELSTFTVKKIFDMVLAAEISVH